MNCVPRGDPRHVSYGELLDLRDFLAHKGHVCRFVALSAVRVRRQVGTVGFYHHLFQRDGGKYFVGPFAVLAGWEGYGPGKREECAKIEKSVSVVNCSGKTVDDAATLRQAFIPHYVQGSFIGVPDMNDQR